MDISHEGEGGEGKQYSHGVGFQFFLRFSCVLRRAMWSEQNGDDLILKSLHEWGKPRPELTNIQTGTECICSIHRLLSNLRHVTVSSKQKLTLTSQNVAQLCAAGFWAAREKGTAWLMGGACDTGGEGGRHGLKNGWNFWHRHKLTFIYNS